MSSTSKVWCEPQKISPWKCVPFIFSQLFWKHLPVVPCSGSWLAQAAIRRLPFSLSNPSHPHPDPCTATVAADILSFIFWNEPKSCLMASRSSPVKEGAICKWIFVLLTSFKRLKTLLYLNASPMIGNTHASQVKLAFTVIHTYKQYMAEQNCVSYSSRYTDSTKQSHTTYGMKTKSTTDKKKHCNKHLKEYNKQMNCTSSLTLWFTSSIWWQVCPENGVVNVASTIKSQCRLKGHLCCHITCKTPMCLVKKGEVNKRKQQPTNWNNLCKSVFVP